MENLAVTSLFLYGTLRHMPLLEVVLGHLPRDEQWKNAQLSGARASWVDGQVFPMIELGQDGAAEGVLLTDLSEDEVARLDFYEGGFGYALIDVETTAGPARMYLPGPEVGPAGAGFDLEDWARAWGALSVEAAKEVMALMGMKPATEVARMFPAIRTRAGARVRAANTPTGNIFGAVQFDSRTLGYADFFGIEDIVMRAERFEGGMTPPLRRAVFLGMDASIVLPYDPVRDRVLLIEQLRLGPIGRGDAGAWQLEPVAGHVDPGETPEESAHREALEEAGLTLTALEPVADCYPSPGASSEFYYIYVGIADLPDDTGGVSGVEAEGENIRSHLLSFDDFMEMIEQRQASVAPLILAGYWLAHHRDRLRAAHTGLA